ncbi:MAG: response regulator [Robiginitomaculum sp.]|nr:response regulator [Robiginitomaculum sp.]
MKIPDQFRSKVQEAANSHSVIAITNADGIIVYVNEHFEALSGYSSKELVGNTHKIVNSGLHSSSFFADLWHHILAGKTWRGHICNKNKQGALYWVDTTIYPALDSNGNIEHFISVRTDISKVVFERNQQRQFRENAELLNQLVEINIPEFTLQKVMEESLKLLLQLSWLKTRKMGGIFLVNSAKERLELAASHNLGDAEYALKKVGFGEDICGRAASQDKAVYASCLESELELWPSSKQSRAQINMPIRGSGGLVGVLTLYFEEGVRRNAEHESFLESFCHTLGLIIENRQQRQHVQMAFVDAVRMQGIADKAREAAEYAAEVKGSFLASMSHEIRTPMNGVLGMLGLLESSSLNEEQSELVDIASGSARSLMTIINDILDFSKYERNGFTLEDEPIELIAEFTKILLPLRKQAQKKGLELNSVFAVDLPQHIIGDITRLGQVLINLVSNAIKFTEGGEIKLNVSVSRQTDSRKLEITVEDPGIGMSQEAQSIIFERFSQADNSITRKFGGTGLGLAIVKQLAEAMLGTVTVQSEIGKGSAFTFSIPLKIVGNQYEQNIDDAKDQEFSVPLNILVAEDNPANQFLMRKLLEAFYHQITIVENGELAVAELSNKSFDMVLMDVRMPVMDGLTATKIIRQSGKKMSMVPIIAVTADVMPEQVAEILASGADAHIAKPINPTDLFEVISLHSRKFAYETMLSDTGT